MRVVPHAAIKRGDCAIFIAANFPGDGSVFNGATDDFDSVVGARCGHVQLAAADRRKKTDFVASMELGIPGREFLIVRRDQRSTEFT